MREKTSISQQSDRSSHSIQKKNLIPFFHQRRESIAANSQRPFFPRLRPIGGTPVQPKLTVNAPDDIYEKEADGMADRVMQMPDPQIQRQEEKEEEMLQMKEQEHTPAIQRKCAACEAEESVQRQEMEEEEEVMMKPQPSLVQRKCAECEEEENLQRKPLAGNITPLVQRKETGGGEVNQQIAASLQSTKGGGRALPENTRNWMESRIRADFSGVRVHTDSNAAQLSRELNAQAFTHGRDIYFNRGKFAPGTSEGKRLLAHELTHVVQQSSGIQQKTIQRSVIDRNVVTNNAILTTLGLTRQEVIDTIIDADADAIQLAQNAEDTLTTQLNNARSGDSVDANEETTLNEELGLSFNNPAHHNLIRQQTGRFRRVRETLESGYLRYLALGIGNISLVGCEAGSCGTNFAFSCPGNRLIVLCQTFWNTPDEQSATILHEPFHIWFDMARHAANALRRADASCFESYALRVSGRNAPASCAGHTAG